MIYSLGKYGSKFGFNFECIKLRMNNIVLVDFEKKHLTGKNGISNYSYFWRANSNLTINTRKFTFRNCMIWVQSDKITFQCACRKATP